MHNAYNSLIAILLLFSLQSYAQNKTEVKVTVKVISVYSTYNANKEAEDYRFKFWFNGVQTNVNCLKYSNVSHSTWLNSNYTITANRSVNINEDIVIQVHAWEEDGCKDDCAYNDTDFGCADGGNCSQGNGTIVSTNFGGGSISGSSFKLENMVSGSNNVIEVHYCGGKYRVKYQINFTPPEPNIPTIRYNGSILNSGILLNDTLCSNPQIELTTLIQIKPAFLNHVKYSYQYRIGNETYEYEEPNPAYCGDSGGCDGGGPIIQTAPFSVAKLPILIDPNLPPCCYEPPTVTKTAPYWRTVPGPMVDAHLQSTQGGKKFSLRSLPGLENIKANTTVRFRVVAHANGTVSPVSGQSLTLAISPQSPMANINLASVQASCTIQPTGSITLPNITSQFTDYRYILRAGDLPSFGTCEPNATNSNNCFPATDKVGSNTGSSLTINQVNPGVYTLFLLNSFGTQGFCPRKIGAITVNAVPNLQVNPTPAPDLLLSCYGVANAQITLATSGGQPNSVSYQLVNQSSGVVANQQTSVPNANVQFQNLDVGNYSLAITDGCTPQINQSFTIRQPAKITEVAFQTADATCADPGNGIVNVQIAKSTGSFDVSSTSQFKYVLFKDGATTPYKDRQEVTNSASMNWADLQAGSYELRASENNGNLCNSLSKSFQIKNPQPLNIASLTIKPVSCFSGNDGTLTVVANGGTQLYAYTLNKNGNPISTNQNGLFTSLTAGAYTISIKNQITCNDTFTSSVISVSEPDKIGINLTSKNISCFGLEDGEITAVVTGGTPAYQYRWQVLLPGGWADLAPIGATLNGLANEQFRLQINDSKACVALSDVVSITEPQALSFLSIQKQDVKCFGETGSLTPLANGGTQPYTYSYKKDGSSALPLTAVTPLTAGSYLVQVADANGCLFTNPTTINLNAPPTPLVATTNLSNYNGVNISCFGGNNGSITILPSGGNGSGYSGYTSSLNGGAFTTGMQYNALTAGNYTLAIKDGRGCIAEQNIELTQSQAILQVQLQNKTDVVCDGELTGVLQVGANGGIAPYTYQKLGSPSQVNGTFANLGADTYTIIVTDANACQAQGSFSIESINPPMVLSAVTTSVSCFGGTNGALQVNTAGGVSPFQYQWQNGTSGSALFNLAQGSYTVTVTDGAGCIKTKTFAITQPPTPLSLQAATVPLCFGKATGSIALKANGGTSPYQYALQNNPVYTNNTTFAVPPGTYTSMARDANGCEVALPVTVSVRPDKPEPNFLAATAPHAQDVIVLIDVSLPKPDSIHWVFDEAAEIVSNNNAAPAIRFVEPGQYDVKMTGFFSGCEYELLKTLTINPFDPTAELEKLPDFVPIKDVKVSPNPNNGSFTLSLTLSKPYAVSLLVYDMLGVAHYQKQLTPTDTFTETINLPQGANGVYLLRVITDTDARDVRVVINK